MERGRWEETRDKETRDRERGDTRISYLVSRISYLVSRISPPKPNCTMGRLALE